MTGHIQGFSGMAGVLQADLGIEDAFLLMQRTGASGKRSTTADYFATIISNGLTPPQDQRL